jgi:hypothetical protein
LQRRCETLVGIQHIAFACEKQLAIKEEAQMRSAVTPQLKLYQTLTGAGSIKAKRFLGFSLKTRQSLMARGRTAAVIVFLIASVNKWPALTEVLAKIYMILPLQEAQNDYRSSFVILLCRYRRRDHRESLRMATGCPVRALHLAEGLEQVGSVPAIRSRSAPSALARVASRTTDRADFPDFGPFPLRKKKPTWRLLSCRPGRRGALPCFVSGCVSSYAAFFETSFARCAGVRSRRIRSVKLFELALISSRQVSHRHNRHAAIAQAATRKMDAGRIGAK